MTKSLYSVCIDYDYSAGESSEGVYSCTYIREFPTREGAETFLKRLENRSVSIRVAPDKPATSYILDDMWREF